MPNTRGRFVWIELVTTDTVVAKAFYASVVGWQTQDVATLSASYTLLFANGVQVGGLMPLSPHARRSGARPAWLGFVQVEDVDASVARVQRLGGRVQHAPVDIPGTGRYAVVSDPQGAILNLFKPLRPTSPPPAHLPGQVGWRELHTTDWPAAYDFYSGLLGWVKAEAHAMGSMGTYQVFSAGRESFGGMFNSPAARTQMPWWLYYFQVTDIDAAADRVTAGGGTLIHLPHQVPGGGWVVQAADPQGAMFGLLGSRTGG
jgi:predicted enzyme related to lactoylglutathione lyase